jgi:hypothetical protein
MSSAGPAPPGVCRGTRTRQRRWREGLRSRGIAGGHPLGQGYPSLTKNLGHEGSRHDEDGPWSVGIYDEDHLLADLNSDRLEHLDRDSNLVLGPDLSRAARKDRVTIHRSMVGSFLPCAYVRLDGSGLEVGWRRTVRSCDGGRRWALAASAGLHGVRRVVGGHGSAHGRGPRCSADSIRALRVHQGEGAPRRRHPSCSC